MSFDSIRASHPRKSGCAKCGEQTAGTVTIQARERSTKGKSGLGASVASKAASFCEPCTVEVYAAVEATFLAARAKEK